MVDRRRRLLASLLDVSHFKDDDSGLSSIAFNPLPQYSPLMLSDLSVQGLRHAIKGIKVEGILRQSADVEEVERRVQEYEQGKTDFSPEEDPHVVGDCVKLPSSPVPASCCTALLEAYNILTKWSWTNPLKTLENSMEKQKCISFKLFDFF